MLPVRVAFDPALPVITAGALDCGERKFGADEPFPWRELGISEGVLHDFWRAGLVYFVPEESAAISSAPAEPKKRRSKQQPQPTE